MEKILKADTRTSTEIIKEIQKSSKKKNSDEHQTERVLRK